MGEREGEGEGRLRRGAYFKHSIRPPPAAAQQMKSKRSPLFNS